MPEQSTDFLVIGGGIIGVNIALQLKQRYPDSKVSLIDKESDFGQHASGRNSGVLHAGFYYSADSLKARFTRDGNRQLTEYCLERGLKINRCGKLVVTRDESELATLGVLLERGRHNGVELTELTDREARAIEPRVRTFARALFSPTTASVDPGEVMKALVEDATNAGIEMHADTAYQGHRGNSVILNRGTMHCGYVINAAGLYADRIARDYGFSKHYRILPFKGLYLYVDEQGRQLNTHIYPVPDIRNPFLGVHFTITATGAVKIGPTAIPAFWREHYQGFDNFRAAEFVEIIAREAGLFARNNNNFRSLAFTEMRKHSRKYMARLASEMVTGLDAGHCRRWGAPGIRAQLLDTRNGMLEMDFHYEYDDRSFHVLNAVSPAFTCSMPFSAYLVDRIEDVLSK